MYDYVIYNVYKTLVITTWLYTIITIKITYTVLKDWSHHPPAY